jgi:hypothetical protein
MKVRVRLYGIPNPPGVSDTVWETVVDFPGGSARECLHRLLAGFDLETRRLFLGPDGELTPDAAVSVNGIRAADVGLAEQALTDGDLLEVALVPGL